MQNVRLTASELANIWSSYLIGSLQGNMLKYFLCKVEDSDIRRVLEYGLKTAQEQLKGSSEIFKEEGLPVPRGFTDEDININAPRLFTDQFFLSYMDRLIEIRINGYSVALLMASRGDVIEYFTNALSSSVELFSSVTTMLQAKGLYIRAPYISTPDKVDFVKNQSFLTGFLGDKRPLESIEISHVFNGIQSNSLRNSVFSGFSQVAKSDDVRKYMLRGKEICSKHIDILSSMLIKSGLPVSMEWDSGVVESTIPPFSDRMMMNHMRAVNVVDVTGYGRSMASCLRHDVAVAFGRLMAELGKMAEDGINILIKHGWLEQAPLAEELKEKKNIH